MNQITLKTKHNKQTIIRVSAECSFCLKGDVIPRGTITNIEQRTGEEYQVFHIRHNEQTYEIPLYFIYHFFQDGQDIPNLFLGNW